MAIHLPLGSVRGTLSGKTLRPGFALEASGLEPHSCGVAGWPSKGWPLLMMRPMAVFWCGRSAIVRCMSGKSRCAPAQLRNRRVLDVSLSNRSKPAVRSALVHIRARLQPCRKSFNAGMVRAWSR